MAGGKQTPRQKLVGMMYLVLTALLALQVSSGVLDKFILLSRSLEDVVRYQLLENNELVKRVSNTVRESGNKKSDVGVLNKLIKIREKTDKVISQIENFKSILIKRAGGTKRKLVGLRNDSVVANLMINNNKGKELKSILNDYTQYLYEVSGKKYSSIALDARDIDFLKNDPNQGRKNFVMLNFKKTPLAAALAILNQFLAQVVVNENDALSIISDALGGDTYKADKLVPYNFSESNVVPVNGRYRSRFAFLAQGDKNLKLTVKGMKVPFRDGFGYIDFAVGSIKSKNGSMEKKSFDIRVSMKNKRGEVEEKIIRQTYTIKEPSVEIKSDSVTALYLNCSNELTINLPDYKDKSKVSFKIEGANFVHKGSGKLLITPTNPRLVKIKISYNGVHVATRELRVRKVPLPQIQLKSAGKIVDERRGVPAPGPRTLKLSVVPDLSFKEFLPKEARYRVSKGEVTLVRGDGRPVVIVPINKANSTRINMAEINEAARAGDRVVIQITEVVRMTSNNTLEKVEIPSIIKNIMITE